MFLEDLAVLTDAELTEYLAANPWLVVQDHDAGLVDCSCCGRLDCVCYGGPFPPNPAT